MTSFTPWLKNVVCEYGLINMQHEQDCQIRDLHTNEAAFLS